MELPSNSNTARQPSPPEEKKVVEKVVTGEVVKKKQPLGKRFIRTFFGGDAKNVAKFVLMEVIVPAAKDLVVEAGQEALHRMVHGAEGRSGGRSYGSRQTNHTNYQRISTPAGTPSYRREESRTISRRGRETHSFDEILLGSRVEADEVLTRMENLMERYGIVSVSDLYNLVGVTPDYMGEKWGWTSLEGSRVVRDRSGMFKLDLPPTEQLAN